MDLRAWVGENFADLVSLPTALRVKNLVLTSHVPVSVVFHSSNPTAVDIKSAEDWTEKEIKKVIPAAVIRERLSKRASRRQRGRRKNYLN